MSPPAVHPSDRASAAIEEALLDTEQELVDTVRHLEAVRLSEMRYRRLFEAAKDGILIVDPATQRIADANPYMTKLLGWTREEYLAKELWQVGLYPDRAASKQAMAQLRSDGTAWTGDLKVRSKTGEALVVEMTCNLYEEGTHSIIQCNVREISDRKKEEAALVHLAAIVNSSQDAIISMDLDGIVTSWNPGAQRLLGYSDEEMTGQSIMRIIPPERREEELHLLARLSKGETLDCVETERLTKDGLRVYVSLTVSPLRDSTGAIIGASKIARDITERIHSQAALCESEVRFRTVADAAPVIIWLADHDRIFDYLNKAWLDFTGHSFDEEIHSAWAERLHQDDLERCLETYHRSFEAREPFEMEYRLRHHSGEYRWLLDRGIPRITSKGTFEGYIGAGIDIHAQKEAAETIRRANESASRAKDQFLAMLSHELRTPLTPVLMLASAMEMSPDLAPQTREDCAMIRKNIELEARLIDDLLDLTRITQGKMVLCFENIDPHPLIEHSLEILRGDLRAKQLQVDTCFCAPAPFICGDGLRLRQVFWNILKNAVKFTPAGGRISIVSYVEGSHWRLDITDTGLGITAEELPQIFTAFTQGKVAAEPSFGGVGLGMAISAHLVNEHHGRIWAESPGRGFGSTFCVELPLAPMPVPGSTKPPPQEPEHRPLRVLLVEDHEASRATLLRLLSLHGHTVTAASSISQALAQAALATFDIVVSDLGLPDGSGHGLMRELSRTHGLCGIALSGFGMADDVKESLEAGFGEHLTKPVNLATLERAMLRVWTSNQGQPSTSKLPTPPSKG